MHHASTQLQHLEVTAAHRLLAQQLARLQPWLPLLHGRMRLLRCLNLRGCSAVMPEELQALEGAPAMRALGLAEMPQLGNSEVSRLLLTLPQLLVCTCYSVLLCNCSSKLLKSRVGGASCAHGTAFFLTHMRAHSHLTHLPQALGLMGMNMVLVLSAQSGVFAGG